MPDSLDQHVSWTRSEWSSNPYMSNVVSFLEKVGIESFIDAGGCTGEFTKIMLERIPSIKLAVILEPVPENYQFIKSNLSDERVTVINKALYQTKKTISLGRVDANVGGWSVNYEGSETYECVSVEELVEKYSPDFMKIDIEGAERDVIENSSALSGVEFLEIEFHDQYVDPSAWREYVSKYLPDHTVVLAGDSWCSQNGFLVRNA